MNDTEQTTEREGGAMRRALVVMATCVFAVTCAGPVLAGSAANSAGKGFAYHPIDTRGQGNMGKPCMRDPYGHDKDRDRLETGNQGRPVECVAPVSEPTPEPEPDPEPEQNRVRPRSANRRHVDRRKDEGDVRDGAGERYGVGALR